MYLLIILCFANYKAPPIKLDMSTRSLFNISLIFCILCPIALRAQESLSERIDPFGFRSKEERLKSLRKYGGDAVTEDAVLKALRWLKANQNADGSWGNTYGPGISGLALLAFLGHGETPKSEEFGRCVSSGINFLVLSYENNRNGYFGDGTYVHGIASFAICEAYGMTRDPKLYKIMNEAVSKIIQGQRDAGGWDYNYGNSSRRDLSAGGWNMQALNAARSASADLPGLREAMKKAVEDVKAHWEKHSGMFAYSDNISGSPTLTGVGTLCLMELDGNSSAEFKGAMRYLVGNAKMEWGKNQSWPLYAWYYQTLTFFKSEQNWDKWNPQMKKVLIANQEDDGNWEDPGGNFGITGIDMKVYSTALCALMLEVYYRYFNISAEEEKKGGNSAGSSKQHGTPVRENEKAEEPSKTDNKVYFKGIPY